MSNPYKLDFNGLNIIIYAENKEQAQMIFDQKISEHNERIKTEALADERAKTIEEFKSKIKECCSIVGTCDFEDLDRIAEQIKGAEK